MTFMTPGADELGLVELFGSVQNQIRELREDLEALKEGARAGEEFKTTAVKESLTRLKGLVSQCSGLEKTLAECRHRQLGTASGGVVFDFDAARSEIGGALDSIRTAGDAKAVSE